jgi:circadian clock protein KaiB
MPKHSPEGDASATYLLRLFVTGTSPRAAVALANLERLCAEQLDGRYRIEVIDVLKEPGLAEDEHVLATPTLIKHLPPPLRRIIGDLSDQEKVLLGLELRPEPLARPAIDPETP